MRPADDGLTIIELAVAMFVSAVIIALIGTVFLQGFSTQREVSSIGSSQSNADVILQSLQSGIGNASSFTVGTATSSGQLVTARTARASSTPSVSTTWVCQAWYYSATLQSIYTTTASSAISAPSSTTDLTAWEKLNTGSSEDGITVTVPADAAAAFAASSTVLVVELEVTDGTTSPVTIETSLPSSPMATATEAPTTC
ncbi:MAG: hypothetical protein QM635_08305 [Microbacteriaceae bacterium]